MKDNKKITGAFILLAFLFIAAIPLSQQGIEIGSQTWTAKNLEVTTFQNGDIITQVSSDMDWLMADAQKKPAWCYFGFDEANKSAGILYNGHAMKDKRGLAPQGWRIPTDEDWKVLETKIGKDANKITSGKSNETGFSANLSGTINASGLFLEESFAYWSTTAPTATGSLSRIVYQGSNQINRKIRRLGDGAYIRLVKQ